MVKKQKIDVDQSRNISLQQSFSDLLPNSLTNTESNNVETKTDSTKTNEDLGHKEKISGRIEIRRLKAGKAGKTVTEIKFPDTTPPQIIKYYFSFLQKKLSCGGSLKSHTIELQGDHREIIQKLLSTEGLKVILAGG